MDIHGYPWITMDIHGYPWISMDIHGYLWISMDIHGYPWISTDIHVTCYLLPVTCHLLPVTCYRISPPGFFPRISFLDFSSPEFCSRILDHRGVQGFISKLKSGKKIQRYEIMLDFFPGFFRILIIPN